MIFIYVPHSDAEVQPQLNYQTSAIIVGHTPEFNGHIKQLLFITSVQCNAKISVALFSLTTSISMIILNIECGIQWSPILYSLL